jgi:hypothetical protein
VPTYASQTDVTSDRSRSEIERTLQRYGARGFMYGWDESRAVLGFVASGRQVRFVLPMPDRSSEDFTLTPTGLDPAGLRDRRGAGAAAAVRASGHHTVTQSATVAAVPDPRDITDDDAKAILDALQARERSQLDVEKAVARALKNGASIRAVQEASGLSPNTIQKYGYAHGWPTAENRRNFNATRQGRR